MAMIRSFIPLVPFIPLLSVPGIATAETLVFEGEITQLEPETIEIPAFDDEGRYRLEAVHIDLYASMYGGYTISGSGERVFVATWYDQRYTIDGAPLAEVTARFAFSMKNDETKAYSFLKTGDTSLTIDNPAELERWQEGEPIEIVTEGEWSHVAWRPLDLLDLGVGLDGTWTITYEYTPL